MRLSARRRSQFIGFLATISGIGMKYGIPLTLLSIVYLLFVIFGPHLRSMPKMTPQNLAYLEHSVSVARTLLIASSIAAVLGLIIRFFYEEVLGQGLALLGGLFFFFTPAILGDLTMGAFKTNPIYQSIINTFGMFGLICLLPGVDLIMRDAAMRIWNGINLQKIMERGWGDEQERVKKFRKPKMYAKCWDMAFCRDFVRNVCPAWKKKKPCWRLKSGCYCDEGTVMRALTVEGKDNPHLRGILHSLGLDKARSDGLSGAQKRARCRRCSIYAEHQRQKYRLSSPMMFPAVGLLFLVFYNQISTWIGVVLERADHFMSFLAYQPGTVYSFAHEKNILTILTLVWLGIMILSYALRGLEYLIFEMQV